MTHIFRVFLACLITISLFISSCVREDDEPIVPENSITRLYISYSDYQSNEDLDPYENVVIIDPADREDLFSVNLKHTSEARGGAALHFSPFAKRLFQSSINTPGRPDTAIYIMSVGNTGVLANSDKGGGKILNSKLTSVKGIFYYSQKDRLYATNLQDSSIYVFNRPSSLNRSEEHTSELQSRFELVCRLLLDTATTVVSTLSLHDALPIYLHHECG